MQKLRKYFGNYDMTWRKVIVFALLTAVVTAVLNIIPFLENTSFQDIAISFECWFLFAIFIIVNCDKWWEASLKCFVFFLISQPLIYLIEVPFNSLGWALFGYYKRWAIITFLTIPGAAIGFLVKKKNWLSVAVLSVATGFLAYMSVYYFISVITDFPHHLISSFFCLILAVFFVFILLDAKKHRTAALSFIAAVMLVTAITSARGLVWETTLPDGNWEYTVSDASVVYVKITDGNKVRVSARHAGSTEICFINENGDEQIYEVVTAANIFVDRKDDWE